MKLVIAGNVPKKNHQGKCPIINVLNVTFHALPDDNNNPV